MLIKVTPCLRFSYLTQDEHKKRVVGEIPLELVIRELGMKQPEPEETRFEVEVVVQTLSREIDCEGRIRGEFPREVH